MNALRLVDNRFPGSLSFDRGPADRARTPQGPLPRPDPRRVLTELLAWNEEMISQLRAERGDDASPGFLTTLIGQHEKTVSQLRAELGAPDVAESPLRQSRG